MLDDFRRRKVSARHALRQVVVVVVGEHFFGRGGVVVSVVSLDERGEETAHERIAAADEVHDLLLRHHRHCEHRGLGEQGQSRLLGLGKGELLGKWVPGPRRQRRWVACLG